MIRCRLPSLVLATLWSSGVISGPAWGDGPIGFAPASRAAEARAEAHALAVPTPEQARAWLRALTREPHVAGTAADHRTALFVRDRLRSWGWRADLVAYEALLNYPVEGSVSLELLRPTPKTLRVVEEPLVADKDSDHPDAFPAFHGYGISGDVKGQVVYANYGWPEDFDALEKLGIEVKGKIVLVRYGALFRGLKVRNAQKRGARGILIYSDPAEDGYTQGDVYPNGPFRPGSAIQRGSVQSLALRPGDPSTPEGPSVKGARRLPIDPRHGIPLPKAGVEDPCTRATGLAREDFFATIPSLPISYDAARPILEALGGPNVPEGWQGGLPLPYHTGPGPAEVHFAVEMDYKVRPIWDVIATLAGKAEPDRWVMVGNHRDAWAYGAVDPGSGTAATLEMCRALGSAVKDGWEPRRTLVYASWDAEEYDLVGSTEWAEDNLDQLGSRAVMMLNVDTAVSGPVLDVGGVPSLRDLVIDAASGVTDARSGKPLSEVWIARRRGQWAKDHPVDLDEHPWSGAEGRGAVRVAPPFSPELNPLGSGSDYTAFLDHLGIPALDVSFSGRYGVYHSTYDNAFWMEKFGDPEFLTHAMAAKLYTLIAMRAAGADVLPLRFTPLGDALREHVDDLRRRMARKARAADPASGRPAFDFAGLGDLTAAVKRFQGRAAALDRATIALAGRDGVDPGRLARVNDALRVVERAFLLPGGLPGRPWFRHALYAPSPATGYGCWPLPALRQAIQDDDLPALAAAVAALVARLDAAGAVMQDAAAACE